VQKEETKMAPVEHVRLPRKRDGETAEQSRVELLDLLASGHPPAFATDSRDRIVFWNQGAAELLGRRPDEAMGLHCYEVLNGRDVFGNRYCYANCPVTATLRSGEPVHGFEMEVAANGSERKPINLTVLRIPSVREDLFTVVHLLQPIEPESRLQRTLDKINGNGVSAPNAAALPAVAEPESGPPLTRREIEVLALVAEGRPNKDVARALDLSLATVRNHIHSILDKLEVHSKLEAVSLAFRRGWVKLPEGAGTES
jgi:DNA-binding CsgD family transcriptional regulator